ncbi:MAG TPA: FMN-binding protein [Spirochaetia bacterium]|nr:FMN-binding protein [Spirochaetia bacterium]
MNTKGKVYTVVFTFVASFIFILLLALVDTLVADQISRNEELSRVRALLNAMNIPYATDTEALRLFHKEVTALTSNGIDYYRYERNGETVYGLIHRGDGLWGTITIAVAVNQDLTRMIGLDVISQNETPGLGARIDESWFKAQFQGERLGAGGRLTVGEPGPGDTDHGNGKVDAITGASLTSRQLGIIVNDALATLRRALGGAG